jgi:hypothetical protein
MDTENTNFHHGGGRGQIFTEAITAPSHNVREMIAAKLKQEDRQCQDSGPPAYREAV